MFFLPPIIGLLPRGGIYLLACCLGNQGTDFGQENHSGRVRVVSGWDQVLVMEEISITYN